MLNSGGEKMTDALWLTNVNGSRPGTSEQAPNLTQEPCG